MAIVVLVSIGAGAIVTLLSGPWMWGSLLILPAAAAVAIALLYRLDDSKLRRSLQFAILISLAVHLLVLIATSLTFIFGNQKVNEPVEMTKRPERKIIVTNRTKQLVFQQPQKHTVPDVQVEPEKQQATTKTKPQPVPVVPEKQNVKQEIVKKRQTESTVPKLAQELSKLSRSRSNAQPKVSRAAAASPTKQQTAQSSTQAQPTKTEIQKSSASASNSPTRQKSDAQTASKIQQTIPTATRRQMESSKLARQRSQSTARLREPTTQVPEISANAPNNNQSKPAKVKSIAKSESTSTNISRQQARQSPARKSNQSPVAKSATTVAASSQRRSTNRSSQSIATKSNARKSERQIAAKSPSSNSQLRQTSPSASTNRSQNNPRPQAVAMTRSTQGTSGTSRSRNLDRLTGGEVSPVNVASDASSRRQSNRASENVAMSSFQKSNLRERGRSQNAQRALRSENIKFATQSGSNSPARMTAQGSAANIESATSKSDSRVAAEKGTSMLDVGATKVVTEATTQRRGGGGSPDISPAIARSSQSPSGRQSNLAPSITANDPAGEFGPVTAAESPDADTDDGALSSSIARSENQNGTVSEKSDAATQPSSSAESLAGNMTGGSKRRSSETTFEGEVAGGESIAKSETGNSRSRIAQAPNVERTVDFGSSGTESARSINPTTSGADSATTEVVRRATDALSGGSVLGTASKMMAASMSSLPLFAEGAGDSQRRSREQNNISDSPSNRDRGQRGSTSIEPKMGIANNPTAQSDAQSFGQIQLEESDLGSIQRQVAKTTTGPAGIELDIDTDHGAGGFADTVSRRVGKPSNAASESDNLSPNTNTRFKRKTFGGEPDVSPIAPIAKKAFRSRNPAALSDSGPQTEAAIERGLEFLARYQLADGSWSLAQFDKQDPLFQNQLNSDTAATGLALLAFQGAGYTHREFKYAAQVKQALDWLVANQDDDGCLYLDADKTSNESCRMYSHAIAALALTEAFGMTQDDSLREPTQAALDYIAKTQDPDKGGWRYFAQRAKRSSDTSVTGWMMMALKSGKLAGLNTRSSTMQRIEDWLRVAEDPDSPSQFRYNPYAVDSQGKSRVHGRKASITMNSVGLLMKVYTGWKPDDERFLRGVKTLLTQLPDDKNSRVRDTYYWYYATQVIRHAGGQYWDRWSDSLHPLLIDSQELSGELRGSWDPYRPVPDRWGPHGGRLYVTTMNLLSLEVKYRLLPLYENTIDD